MAWTRSNLIGDWGFAKATLNGHSLKEVWLTPGSSETLAPEDFVRAIFADAKFPTVNVRGDQRRSHHPRCEQRKRLSQSAALFCQDSHIQIKYITPAHRITLSMKIYGVMLTVSGATTLLTADNGKWQLLQSCE